MIKKADIVLFISILIVGIALSVCSYVFSEPGSLVKVTVGGDLYGSYDLSEDQTVEIKSNSHTNKIIIKDGKVSMAFSDCNGQDCVIHAPISETSESITCLPNKVMITIESNGEEGYDVISN